jgi:hypothetical protein
MSKEAMLPCIVCGVVLDNVEAGVTNQPSEGTEFDTFGHYGSTFWDDFTGEEIAVNICDDCLNLYKERIGRRKRYVRLVVTDPRGVGRVYVGRQWVDREMVGWFDGASDDDAVEIEIEQIGDLKGYGRIEWAENAETIRTAFLAEQAEEDS